MVDYGNYAWIMFYKFVNKKSRTVQVFHPSFSVSFLLHIGQFILYKIIIKSPLSSKKAMDTITVYCIKYILFYRSMVHCKKICLFFQMSLNHFHIPTFVTICFIVGKAAPSTLDSRKYLIWLVKISLLTFIKKANEAWLNFTNKETAGTLIKHNYSQKVQK